jgi:hypothetical protein
VLLAALGTLIFILRIMSAGHRDADIIIGSNAFPVLGWVLGACTVLLACAQLRGVIPILGLGLASFLLSDMISFALVVPSISEWQSWPALTSAQHQKPVRVATTGPRGGTGLFATILAKLGGFPIEMVTVNSTLAVALEALDQHVDAAVVNTYDIKLLNMMSNNALVPIITSGAARSPDFPDTPTISEITGDRTLDFTTSVSVSASRAMNDALAERLTRAFLAAGKASEAMMAATQMNFPLQVDGPEVVEETLARNRRVGMRFREILERTP